MRNLRIELREYGRYGYYDVTEVLLANVSSLTDLIDFLKSKELIDFEYYDELWNGEEFLEENIIDGNFEDSKFDLMLGYDLGAFVEEVK